MFLFRVEDIIKFHQHVSGSTKWRKVLQIIIKTTLWCIGAAGTRPYSKGYNLKWGPSRKKLESWGTFGVKIGQKPLGLLGMIGVISTWDVWAYNVTWCDTALGPGA
ncbi:hypothetical protein HanPI659440_Chr13g0513581 [Helianthus annuus]|nr:hypothetical protein HanPI659440_Chr13g0513581 [Helianthus annuus]